MSKETLTVAEGDVLLVKQKISEVEQKISQVEQKISQVEQKISQVEQELNACSIDVKEYLMMRETRLWEEKTRL